MCSRCVAGGNGSIHHPNQKPVGSRTRDKDGRYWLEKALNGKWVWAHRLVLERKLGRVLARGEVAHHICKEIGCDDYPSCLNEDHIVPLANHRAHMKHHVDEYVRDPEWMAWARDRMKKMWTPERRAQVSETLRRVHAEKRAARTPEEQEAEKLKWSTRSRKLWADPVYRERTVARMYGRKPRRGISK